jgi:FtsP/CotA-like multicopper oxidase with cupredoxin domain
MKTAYVIAALLAAGFLAGYVTAVFWAPTFFPNIFKAVAQQGNVREYTIIIQPAQIELAPGVVWNAWTYNGTVPGPTLYAKVGDLIRIRAINKLNLTHSLHPHLPYYDLQHDGSQVNILTGVGKGSMIPPDGEWVYEWPATKAGIWYYHCHSADGGHRIVDHMLMGLYGAIIVDEVDEPPARNFVVFMAETPAVRGAIVGTGQRPFYIMNGMGVPGGEPELEKIYVGQKHHLPTAERPRGRCPALQQKHARLQGEARREAEVPHNQHRRPLPQLPTHTSATTNHSTFSAAGAGQRR